MFYYLFYAAIIAVILPLLWLIVHVGGVFKGVSQKRKQKKLAAKLDKLAIEQNLVFTDQLFHSSCGVSLSVDRRARKIAVSRNPYPDPIILDLDSITWFSVQNDLEAFRDLKDKYWDIVVHKVLHQEAVILAYKNTVGKPVASITLHTRNQKILLPFFINEDYDVNEKVLYESGQIMGQFIGLLNDILK